MRLTNIFKAVAMTIASLTLTSCLDDEVESTFDISINGYLLEEEIGGTTYFTPYVYFTSTNSSCLFESLTITGDSASSRFDLRKVNDYLYMTTDKYKFTSPDKFNGKYAVSALSTTKRTSTTTFTMSFEASDGLSPIEVDTFYYDGSKVTAVINEMEGKVYNVGFVFTGYNSGSTPDRTYSTYFSSAVSPSFVNGKLEFTTQFYNSTQLTSEYANVKVFVSTPNAIYRESRAKTITKDCKTFVEDK